MSDGRNLDEVLSSWPFEPGSVSVRLVNITRERQVIQMRIELGILQLETTGRPDGWQPEGADSYFDHLLQLQIANGDFEMTEEQCFECDREFVQYYHRRICWLAMQEYEKAVADADHTLGLMDFCREHSPDEQWTLTHEQYRPFVLYHRIQADAMHHLLEEQAEQAVQAINRGLEQLRSLFVEQDVSDDFEDDELVTRLIELRESLRDKYEVGRTLPEQLADAVAAEQYELAARIRDKIHKRTDRH